jgi:uncharacterized protein (UPF0335 family)
MKRKVQNITDKLCSFYNTTKDTVHIILECKEYTEEKKKIKDEVYKILAKRIGKGYDRTEMERLIPYWFEKTDETGDKTKVMAGAL